MMKRSTILHDLILASNRIENRIDELLSSAIQEEFDSNATLNRLINEAVDILLDILKENGIYFHTDLDDLKSDRYGIGFIVFLNRFFNTINVIHTIKTTPGYLQELSGELVNVPDDEVLVYMLQIMKDLTLTTYHNEMYVYLHDKIFNDERYTKFIFDTIDTLTVQADNVEISFDEQDTDFLSKLSDEKHWFERCVNNLIHKGALPINIIRANQLIKRFSLTYSSPEHIKMFSRYRELVETNELVIQGVLKKIHSSSDLYEDYYSDTDLNKIQICTVVGIILSKISDYKLFGITPNYTRLIKFCSNGIPVKSIIEMIPTDN